MEFDCYKLLGIPSYSDVDTITKAFRIKSLEKHPDRNNSVTANDEFIQLKKAADILLDSTKRLQHDRHFGYTGKPKNKDENAKQDFSKFQKEKAKDLVKEWSSDYEIAMRARQGQKDQYAKLVRKRIILFWIALGFAVAIFVTVLLFFLSFNPFEGLAAPK